MESLLSCFRLGLLVLLCIISLPNIEMNIFCVSGSAPHLKCALRLFDPVVCCFFVVGLYVREWAYCLMCCSSVKIDIKKFKGVVRKPAAPTPILLHSTPLPNYHRHDL